MASLSPRERANRCFAVARSTTFDGERESAIARGIAIAEKAGLDLGSFDIPGRAGHQKNIGGDFAYSAGSERHDRAGETPDFKARNAPERYTRAEFNRVMAAFHQHMRDAGRSTAEDLRDELMARFADAGSVFAAGYERGRAERAQHLHRQRQAQHARWPDIAALCSFLMARGVMVYDLGQDPEDDLPRWYLPGRHPDRRDEWGLRAIADELSVATSPDRFGEPAGDDSPPHPSTPAEDAAGAHSRKPETCHD